MRNAQRYSYVSLDTSLGEAGFRPYLPLVLAYQEQQLQNTGLLDTTDAIAELLFSYVNHYFS